MKLDTPHDRRKFINTMWKRAFDFQESLIHDKENGDDWLGAINAVDNLATIDEFIITEDIFYCMLDDIGEVYSKRGSNQVYQDIVHNNLVHFVDTILLRRIEHTLEFIEDWDFKLERGQKLRKYLCDRLEKLINKYQDIYDL